MAAGVRFRPVRRRRPAAEGSSAGSSASTLRTPLARRPSVSARLAVGRDDMSSKEGGVLGGPGRSLFKGGGSPSFLSDFPLRFPLEGLPSPHAGSGEGRGEGRPGPGDFLATSGLCTPGHFLNPRAVFLMLVWSLLHLVPDQESHWWRPGVR